MASEHIYALSEKTSLTQGGRKYEVRNLLGHGAFGLTYRAYDYNLDRYVAIKEMFPIDFAMRARDGVTVVAKSPNQQEALDWAKRRFLDEAKTLAKLQHHSLLTIHDYFEGNGTAYFVSPFIQGVSLEDWLKQRDKPSERELFEILCTLLNALKLAHEINIFHRDIKPENILMEDKGSLPVLIDFGNAREANALKTSNLSAVLTHGYAPFEQYQTDSRQGPWTDLYALGAVLYRAITGDVPPWSTDRHGSDTLVKLSNNPSIQGYSNKFLSTIDKALRLRREERWQTCSEWLEAVTDSKTTNHQNPPKPTIPWGKIVGVTFVLLSGIAGGFTILQYRHKDNPSPGELPKGSPPPIVEIPASPTPTLAATPVKVPEPSSLNRNTIGMEFVPVKINDFDDNGKEIPMGTMWFSKFETTNKDYKTIVPTHPSNDDKPVTGLTQDEVQIFLKKLSDREKRVYRLPTDHEWSCAVGLHEHSNDTLMEKEKNVEDFPWGKGTSDKAIKGNYNNEGGLVSVFESTTNSIGLYGMGGNVSEMCVSNNGGVLLRGGSFKTKKAPENPNDNPDLTAKLIYEKNRFRPLSSAHRDLIDGIPSGARGFRCVIEP